MLKKIGLSAFVIVAFIAYTFQQRHEASGSITPAPAATQPTAQTDTTQSQPSSNSNSSTSTQTAGKYKSGTYTGDSADALYGNIQVKVTISNGQITDIVFIDYPQDRDNSVRINTVAMPILKQEAIRAQSAHVNIVTGATDTSNAFIESLNSALNQAQA